MSWTTKHTESELEWYKQLSKKENSMDNDFIDGLLADIPLEEVVDKRLGVHDEAVLREAVTISTNEYEGKLLYSLVAKFQITDAEDQTAIVQQNISVPDSEAPNGYKQQLLSWLHAFKILPPTSKNAPILPVSVDEDTRRSYVEKIAAAVNTRVGENVPITVYLSKSGFVNARANKVKPVTA